MSILNYSQPLIKDFMNFICERTQIWSRRYKGSLAPWTADPILARYRFINIYRELDRFSREEISRIKGKSLLEQIKIIALGRYTLSWPTYDFIIQDGVELTDVYDFWEKTKSGPSPFIGGAIQMYPPKNFDRAKCLLHYKSQLSNAKNIEEAYQKNKNAMYLLSKIAAQFDLIGAFRAYEIYTSLTYSKHIYYKEDDIFLVGPGTLEGLHNLLGKVIPNSSENAYLIDIADEVKEFLLQEKEDFVWIPKNLQGSQNNKVEYKFTVRTVEDCICEFRKYTALKNNGGRHRIFRPNFTSIV